MLFKSYELGPLTTNSYLIGSEETKEVVIIDPACEDDTLVNVVKADNLKLLAIINTHYHRDHTAGNYRLKEHFDVPIQIHEEDAQALRLPQDVVLNLWFKEEKSPSADILLKDGDIIEVGDLRLKVIFTPGHTLGGMCLLVENEGILFSGDTIMAGSIGRTDLMGGSYEDIIQSIKTRIMVLDDSTKVFPGHGGSTTIENEKQYNMFLK